MRALSKYVDISDVSEIELNYTYNVLEDRINSLQKQIENVTTAKLGVVVPDNVNIPTAVNFCGEVEKQTGKKVYPVYSFESKSTNELLKIKQEIDDILKSRKIKEI